VTARMLDERLDERKWDRTEKMRRENSGAPEPRPLKPREAPLTVWGIIRQPGSLQRGVRESVAAVRADGEAAVWNACLRWFQYHSMNTLVAIPYIHCIKF
jgi:hypothetical protein